MIKIPAIEISKNMKELLEKIAENEKELSINNLIWKMFAEYAQKRGYWKKRGNNLKLNLS